MDRLALLSPLLLLAGCVEAPDESREGDPCGAAFVTIQYEGTGEGGALRERLQENGYVWEDAGDGIAHVRPSLSESVRGTISQTPGPSGEDLIVSIEETSRAGTIDSVRAVASDVSGHVNATYPDARVADWIEGAHDAGCA